MSPISPSRKRRCSRLGGLYFQNFASPNRGSRKTLLSGLGDIEVLVAME